MGDSVREMEISPRADLIRVRLLPPLGDDTAKKIANFSFERRLARALPSNARARHR